MKYRLLFLMSAFLFAFGIDACTKPSPASASYVPPNTICWYELVPGHPNPLTYPCPVLSAHPATIISGTNGVSGYTYTHNVGVNIHFAYAQYQNYPYILNLLKAANIHLVRDGSSIIPGNSYAQNSMNGLGAAGIKLDLIVGQNQSSATIGGVLSSINPNYIFSLEGPNELDICCGDANWAADDAAEQPQIWNWAKANAPNTMVLGPSLGGNNSYAALGDLSAYEDAGVMHDYGGGFPPETTGYGSIGYCGDAYGSEQYNICNAKQASISKPIASTEFGDNITGQVNGIDNLAQGTYLLRKVLYHFVLGVPVSIIYQLWDSGDSRGLVDVNGNQRQSYLEVAGFQNILNDPTPFSGNCIVPALVPTPGIDSLGICKSNGEYDLILWQPVASYGPYVLVDNTVTPINANITMTSGFGPTSTTVWNYDINGNFTNTSSPNTTALPVTDRPSIVVFNGTAFPTPMPALPTSSPP